MHIVLENADIKAPYMPARGIRVFQRMNKVLVRQCLASTFFVKKTRSEVKPPCLIRFLRAVKYLTFMNVLMQLSRKECWSLPLPGALFSCTYQNVDLTQFLIDHRLHF